MSASRSGTAMVTLDFWHFSEVQRRGGISVLLETNIIYLSSFGQQTHGACWTDWKWEYEKPEP
jgi:hypothetical protein